MMKRMLLAAAAVATLATISFTAAPAEAKVVIYGGVPYHGYAVAPHWRYYYGRGWYDPYQYNYVQPGKTITLAAPYAVSSGDGLLVGAIFGVATASAAIGEAVSPLKPRGVSAWGGYKQAA